MGGLVSPQAETMTRALAINVGANTTLPGVRGPIDDDGRFVFVPIPERAPIDPDATVPTYGDLQLPVDLPSTLHDRPVHLDPEFEEYPHGRRYTYGDEHGVKAGPIADLHVGDTLYFYATLESRRDPDGRLPGTWGAYLVGRFTLAREPIVPATVDDPSSVCERVPTNAHCKRRTFDAEVVVLGESEGSGLFECAVPLSQRLGGASPNRIVTEWSSDSGKGPWWRRPLRFEPAMADRLAEHVRTVQRRGLSAGVWDGKSADGA